jgi:hypothetical protein
MTTSRHELNFIQAGIFQLKDYLLSEQIYRPVGIRASPGRSAYPPLTLGTLMLFLHQAEALLDNSELQLEFTRYKSEIDEIHARWQVHWQKKAAAEFSARLKLWRDFLEEYRKDPEGNYDRYTYEVTRRVMLYWLEQDTKEQKPDESLILGNLDRLLKTLLIRSSFIWDGMLEPEFPEDIFWYLYGKLPPSWPVST